MACSDVADLVRPPPVPTVIQHAVWLHLRFPRGNAVAGARGLVAYLPLPKGTPKYVLRELESDLLGWHFWRTGRRARHAIQRATGGAPRRGSGNHGVTDFLAKRPTLDANWPAVVLFGRNVASYKFALANRFC
jgi:hypothetical protein